MIPQPQQFVTVFNVTEVSFIRWRYLLPCLLGLLVGTMLVVLRAYLLGGAQSTAPSTLRVPPRWVGPIVIGLAGLLTLVRLGFMYSECRALSEVVKEGRCKIAAGIVEDFTPAPVLGRGRRDDERFKIADVEFRLSPFDTSVAYNEIVARGGEIRPGVYVRVCFVDADKRRILKVELKK